MKPVKFEPLTETTRIPERATPGAAGYDIYCDEPKVIGSGCRAIMSTGWAMEMPEGYYAEIRPRSGLASKLGIDTMAGVIDSDYRGEVKVMLINHGAVEVDFITGTRVAQLIFRKHETPNIMAVESLGDSARGTNGFGSTGK